MQENISCINISITYNNKDKNGSNINEVVAEVAVTVLLGVVIVD